MATNRILNNRVQLRVTSYKRAHKKTRHVLDKLNFGWSGNMSRALGQIKDGLREDCPVVYAVRNGQIIGWAMFLKSAMWNSYKDSEINMYVASTARRQGVGAKIFKKARKVWGKKFKVCPHDDVSRGFYNTVDV